MSRKKTDTRTSIEKMDQRSDYERGKLDGLAEAVELVREFRAELNKRHAETYPEGEPHPGELTFASYMRGFDQAAKRLWMIYRRRAI